MYYPQWTNTAKVAISAFLWQFHNLWLYTVMNIITLSQDLNAVGVVLYQNTPYTPLHLATINYIPVIDLITRNSLSCTCNLFILHPHSNKVLVYTNQLLIMNCWLFSKKEWSFSVRDLDCESLLTMYEMTWYRWDLKSCANAHIQVLVCCHVRISVMGVL